MAPSPRRWNFVKYEALEQINARVDILDEMLVAKDASKGMDSSQSRGKIK